MSRVFIKELEHQGQVDEIYQASGKQLRPNRNGDLYLQVELSDRTGMVTARLWNAGQRVYDSFQNGDYLHVIGSAQLYQGAMQVIAKKITVVPESKVDPADFTQVASVDVTRLIARMRELIHSIGNPQLQILAECFIADTEFIAAFAETPAGIKHHHAYRGGLLEHTVTIMDAASRIAPCYPTVDRDLLLIGAMLHDIGKVQELVFAPEAEYSDHGQLLGHVILAMPVLEEKLAEAERLAGEPIDPEIVLRLKHMIVSHHGQYEFGSPRLPMTPEAIALHFLDNLDAKINAFGQLIDADPNADSRWTHYQPSLNRKLYKGRRPGDSDS